MKPRATPHELSVLAPKSSHFFDQFDRKDGGRKKGRRGGKRKRKEKGKKGKRESQIRLIGRICAQIYIISLTRKEKCSKRAERKKR